MARVKDFNDLSLKDNISGLTISAGKNNYWRAAIKLDTKQLFAADRQIRALWNTTFPDQIYYSNFVNDSMQFVDVIVKGNEFLEEKLDEAYGKAEAEKSDYLNADSIATVY